MCVSLLCVPVCHTHIEVKPIKTFGPSHVIQLSHTLCLRSSKVQPEYALQTPNLTVARFGVDGHLNEVLIHLTQDGESSNMLTNKLATNNLNDPLMITTIAPLGQFIFAWRVHYYIEILLL